MMLQRSSVSIVIAGGTSDEADYVSDVLLQTHPLAVVCVEPCKEPHIPIGLIDVGTMVEAASSAARMAFQSQRVEIGLCKASNSAVIVVFAWSEDGLVGSYFAARALAVKASPAIQVATSFRALIKRLPGHIFADACKKHGLQLATGSRLSSFGTEAAKALALYSYFSSL